MKVLLDLSPLKAGGGVQVALGFLETLRENATGLEWSYLLPDVGPLSAVSVQPVLGRAPSGSLARARFEYRTLPKLLRAHGIDTIFTHFGAGLPHPASIKSVVGVAYPIVCYPDSPFWNYLPILRKVRQLAINRGRLARLRSADHVIVETTIMKERLALYAGIALDRMTVVPPYPSKYVRPGPTRKWDGTRPFNFLFLSGLSRHKNLWRLPFVARALRELGEARFTFTLTTSEASWAAQGLATEDVYLSMREHFVFAGAVAPQEINRLYAQADALVSLSDLESFSNNYMEAWQARVPLLVSDRDFARHICNDSAVYVEPHEPHTVGREMIHLMGDAELRDRLVTAGDALLAQLPAPVEKLAAYVNLIR